MMKNRGPASEQHTTQFWTQIKKEMCFELGYVCLLDWLGQGEKIVQKLGI